ncbi:hypothetical protein V5O48_000523 [Marasmius crinis-equi]|uniref:NAD(P)-binding protein n=1 Tax=Marasmius crinis-equi TaxID=585013 RepID=A0ABR3G1N4_9AGAR
MGGFLSRLDEWFPPKPTWTPDNIPDLTGKIAIVTGGNTGLGKLTVQELLKHNAKVYLAARNKKSAEETIEELRTRTGKEAIFLQLDLADLTSIKTCADEFLGHESELHLLYNNAGVMQPPFEKTTAQGFDLQFGVNVLGHFYLTKLLLPTLLSTAKKCPEQHVRVVTVSSMAHVQFPQLKFDTFKDSPARSRVGYYNLPGVVSSQFLYGQSKFGNIVFAKELARRYGDQGIISTSVHPGAIDTGLWTAGTMPWIIIFIARLIFLHPMMYGVYTQLYAGTAPETAKMNGEYFVPWARRGKPHRNAEDAPLGKKLWEYMEEQVHEI